MAEPNFPFPFPTVCSDDVPSDQYPASFQTGQAVDPAHMRQPPPAAVPQSRSFDGVADLQTDAERVDRPSQNQQRSTAPPMNQQRDKITIQGGKSVIIAEGLAGAMVGKGTVFQLGADNHMTVYQSKGHSEDRKGRPKIPNKQPITTSQKEPLQKQLDAVCEGLSSDWRRLGRHFNFSDAVLDQIRMDYYMDGQHEVNYRMLLRWKQEDVRTLQTLAKALVDIGRGDLADLFASG